MKELTKKQARVLAFLKSFREKNDYAPSMAEITKNFGWNSTNAAAQYCSVLEKKGFIKKDQRAHRNIIIL